MLNLPPRIIKGLEDVFVDFMHFMHFNFDKCLNEGIFPDDLKKAKVRPVHKKSNKTKQKKKMTKVTTEL